MSCTVTNNLYVNNPTPLGKGNGEIYAGIGTGVTPKVDSITAINKAVNFSNRISTDAILSIGGQIGIGDRTSLRLAIHFPRLVGGFGFRAGVQRSLYDSASHFNVAIATDVGFVVSKDSIKILGSSSAIEAKEINGAFNADVFIPMSFELRPNVRLVLTPRYSVNTFFMRRYQDNKSSRPFGIQYPAFSLGLRIKRFCVEATALYYQTTIYPHVGTAFFVKN